jgi:hypothetical protein
MWRAKAASSWPWISMWIRTRVSSPSRRQTLISASTTRRPRAAAGAICCRLLVEHLVPARPVDLLEGAREAEGQEVRQEALQHLLPRRVEIHQRGCHHHLLPRAYRPP